MATATQQAASSFNWMPIPDVPLPDCPPGLEYLLQLDRFIVSRFLVQGFVQGRNYRVRNTLGQDVFYIQQNVECNCSNSLQFTVTDSYQRQVAVFESASSDCCSAPLRNMEAEAPPGNTIGGIRSDYAIALHQWFSIIDGSGQTVLKITRSTGNFFSPEVDFKILSADATTEVGVITRQYAGFMKALFNFEAQHTFGITFPMDLDVRMKVVMILAAIVMDMYYFESSK